jgi:hypothetical protein
MASTIQQQLSKSFAAPPSRPLVLAVLLAALLPVALSMITAEETNFYRKNGMVPNARTAARLAQMVLDATPGDRCVVDGSKSASLTGEVWTVQAIQQNGGGLCRVQLDRKDGQILKVEARP